MCNREDCYFISIIELNDEGEKVIIHYDKKGGAVFIQHSNPTEEVFRGFCREK